MTVSLVPILVAPTANNWRGRQREREKEMGSLHDHLAFFVPLSWLLNGIQTRKLTQNMEKTITLMNVSVCWVVDAIWPIVSADRAFEQPPRPFRFRPRGSFPFPFQSTVPPPP